MEAAFHIAAALLVAVLAGSKKRCMRNSPACRGPVGWHWICRIACGRSDAAAAWLVLPVLHRPQWINIFLPTVVMAISGDCAFTSGADGACIRGGRRHAWFIGARRRTGVGTRRESVPGGSRAASMPPTVPPLDAAPRFHDFRSLIGKQSLKEGGAFVGSPMDIAASLLPCNYHHVRSAWRSTTICLDTTFPATADNERWCLHAYGRGTLRPKCRVRDDMGVPAACPTPVCAQAPAGDPSACTETSAENLSQTGIQITMHVACEQPSSLGDVELSKG